VPDYSTIRTQFVADRLKQTRWEDREYIQHLMGIEKIVLQGGPQNPAARLLFERLVRRYPVEHGSIVVELRRGEVTTDCQFRLLSEAQEVLWRRQEELSKDEEARMERKKSERLTKELDQWLRMGGLE